MKNRLYLSLGVVALCLAGCTPPNTQSEKSSSAKQTWEYKQLQITRRVGSEKSTGLQYAESPSWTEDDKEIPAAVNMVSKAKELGDQGWELVSVTAIPGIAAPSGSYAGFADVVVYWFKRPISAPDKQTR